MARFVSSSASTWYFPFFKIPTFHFFLLHFYIVTTWYPPFSPVFPVAPFGLRRGKIGVKTVFRVFLQIGLMKQGFLIKTKMSAAQFGIERHLGELRRYSRCRDIRQKPFLIFKPARFGLRRGKIGGKSVFCVFLPI